MMGRMRCFDFQGTVLSCIVLLGKKHLTWLIKLNMVSDWGADQNYSTSQQIASRMVPQSFDP